MTKPNLNLKPHQVLLAVFLKIVREEEYGLEEEGWNTKKRKQTQMVLRRNVTTKRHVLNSKNKWDSESNSEF